MFLYAAAIAELPANMTRNAPSEGVGYRGALQALEDRRGELEIPAPITVFKVSASAESLSHQAREDHRNALTDSSRTSHNSIAGIVRDSGSDCRSRSRLYHSAIHCEADHSQRLRVSCDRHLES